MDKLSGCDTHRVSDFESHYSIANKRNNRRRRNKNQRKDQPKSEYFNFNKGQ